jgi:cytochrome c peroxidase
MLLAHVLALAAPVQAVPLGLPAERLLAVSSERDEVRLVGRRLFFDPILSSDRTVACASCHAPEHGFADERALSTGVHGRQTLRNAPTLYNRALGLAFMWDGRARTLEEQVVLPIENELEMDLALPDAVARLAGEASYAAAFEEALGGPPSKERLAAALAGFVRSLWNGESGVDRFRAGDYGALSDAARSGLWLFESRGGCWRCHSGANFTDEDFHNTGVGGDDGRFAVTGIEADRGRFKTPTLRGVAETAPYMHDGSLASLDEVVELYRRGGRANPNLDPRLRPIEMTDEDAANLVAFLRALSGTGTR